MDTIKDIGIKGIVAVLTVFFIKWAVEWYRGEGPRANNSNQGVIDSKDIPLSARSVASEGSASSTSGGQGAPKIESSQDQISEEILALEAELESMFFEDDGNYHGVSRQG